MNLKILTIREINHFILSVISHNLNKKKKKSLATDTSGYIDLWL